MSSFQLYLQLGFEHIADFAAYDHILFVIVLCAVYGLKDWKKVAILVTAFTIGHSITLALSTLNVILISSAWVEFLIPITILLTALFNIFQPNNLNQRKLKYASALFFGLIHGLGFSNYLKALLGQEESILQPLLAFNLGLELGQLLIVALFLLSGFAVTRILGIQQRIWGIIVSAIVALLSIPLIIQNAAAL